MCIWPAFLAGAHLNCIHSEAPASACILKDKLAWIEAPCTEELEDMVQCFAVEKLLTGQNPKQLAVFATHYRVGVVRAKHNDIIV